MQSEFAPTKVTAGRIPAAGFHMTVEMAVRRADGKSEGIHAMSLPFQTEGVATLGWCSCRCGGPGTCDEYVGEESELSSDDREPDVAAREWQRTEKPEWRQASDSQVCGKTRLILCETLRVTLARPLFCTSPEPGIRRIAPT